MIVFVFNTKRCLINIQRDYIKDRNILDNNLKRSKQKIKFKKKNSKQLHLSITIMIKI